MGREAGRGQGRGLPHAVPGALRCSPGSSRLRAGVAPSHSAQERGRDPDVSLPAANIKAASVFNVRTAEHSVHSLWGLHPEGHQCPRPSCTCTASPARLAPSTRLCRGPGEPLPPCAPARARGSWGCTSGPAASGPWPAMGISAPSLPPPQVGLDGVGRSHGCDEADGVRQPEGDVLRGAGGREQRGQHLLVHRAQGDGVPRRGAGLHRSPVQNHHHHSPVGPQERRVLQRCLLGLFGGDEPHALGALRDEFTEQTNKKQPQGGSQTPGELLASQTCLAPLRTSCCWSLGSSAHVVGSNPPEVPHVVEHGLFVEDAFVAVHDDGAVHIVLDPVGAPLQIQGQIPVSPAGHKVVQILQQDSSDVGC